MSGSILELALEALEHSAPAPWSCALVDGELTCRVDGASEPFGFLISIRARRHHVSADITADRMFNYAARMSIVSAIGAGGASDQLATAVNDVGRVTEWKTDDRDLLLRVAVEILRPENEEHSPLVASLLAGVLGEIIHTSGILEFDSGSTTEHAGSDDSLEVGLPEGARTRIVANRYERDPRNRAIALLAHGHRCAACAIDLGEAYGPLAQGRIHVHHLTPVSQLGASYVCNPVADLVPLCPNCHFVCHLRTPPLTVAELQELHRQKSS